MLVYECKICGKIGDSEEPFKNPVCCGQSMDTTYIHSELHSVYVMPEYYSPIDNRPILTSRQRREDFERNNARPYEGREQEEKEARKRQKEIEAKQDKALERAITETYYQLPPEKRRLLEST